MSAAGLKSMAKKIPGKDEIREQLQRITEASDFKRSPKIARFLEYLVDEYLQGRKNYIKAYSIGVTVFEKDQSFDPQSDPLVRVNAVRLRRMLRQYYYEEGINDNVVIDIVRGSYIPKFYYREFIEDDTKQEIEILQESSFPSVAVLNFNNKTKKNDYNYLAEGIAQEIIIQLSKIKEICVIGRSAIDLDENVYQSTKRLRQLVDVRYVLSGNVYILDNKIRVYVELDDISSFTNLWTDVYEKNIDTKNIVSIEEDIATHVATTIAEPYGVIIRKELANLHLIRTEDLTAYQLYLHYYQFALTLSREDHQKARAALEKSVSIDPNFSAAWAALSIIYSAEYQFSYNILERELDIRDLALEAAHKAIKIEPENSGAYYALVFAKMTNQGVKSCIEEAEKAYSMNSNNSLLIAIHGTRLAISGNWTRGLELVEEAMELNLSFPDFYYFPLVLNYYRQGRIAEAIEVMQNIELPNLFWMHLINAALYSDIGDLKQAHNSINKLEELHPEASKYVVDGFDKWNLEENLILKFKNSLHQAGFIIE